MMFVLVKINPNGEIEVERYDNMLRAEYKLAEKYTEITGDKVSMFNIQRAELFRQAWSAKGLTVGFSEVVLHLCPLPREVW